MQDIVKVKKRSRVSRMAKLYDRMMQEFVENPNAAEAVEEEDIGTDQVVLPKKKERPTTSTI